jgi:hypothetical protein
MRTFWPTVACVVALTICAARGEAAAYACQEANYSLRFILQGGRARDADSASIGSAQ